HLVAAVATSRASLDTAGLFLPGVRLLQDGAEAAKEADVILITTKDGQIKAACDDLVGHGAVMPSHTVMHMSGAASLDLLASAKAVGAKVACLHPIQSFASIELAIERLPGSYFGLTDDGAARAVALQIAHDLDGTVVEIADKDKPLYHAAACVASNYLVTLLTIAEEMYRAAGFEKDAALEAMIPLVKGTLANIGSAGTVAALTGPISRGDVATIEQHLRSLSGLSADTVAAYRAMGLRTIDIAVKSGTLHSEAADKLSAVLKGGG
ncbi:MAG TPA: Rossmann-like and DUF2520 domain-containing protein, partial [Anaerolineae bacterium]|nr:Rossmann-like and DUF2520 domain-containing protein [Anaerolineae bacterium]